MGSNVESGNVCGGGQLLEVGGGWWYGKGRERYDDHRPLFIDVIISDGVAWEWRWGGVVTGVSPVFRGFGYHYNILLGGSWFGCSMLNTLGPIQ